MNDFATRLNELMNEKGIRQVDIATKTGINKGRISRWMSGSNIPSGENLAKLAKALGVSSDYLLGKSSFETTVPVIGRVAAGIPMTAQEDIVGKVPVFEKQEGYFALKIKGDSMSPRIMDGDIVLVRPQSYADDGDLVIAEIDGEATCKVLKRNAYGVTLIPFNGAYSPIVYSLAEAEGLHILGKVVESRHEW